MEYQFEWDENKAQINLKKHQVNFEEAQTVFDDPLACIFDDERHSFGEKREIMIGFSSKNRLLLVCFTERNNNIIRIFSSRLATKQERRNYESNNPFSS
jgi:uncharacterized DUF497 family protein